MFPKKFYEHFGNRIKMNLISSGTLFYWDNESEHLTRAKGYMLLQM